MNFQNLETEIKKYSDYFKYSQSTILKLSIFYKEIGKIGSKFADRMKRLLDEFFVELIREDRSTTYNKLLTNFYNEKNRFINKIKSYFSLLEKNYGERLSDFEKDYQKKNKEIITKLSKMKETLSDCKGNVDKWKNQYFDMCKSIVETSKKIKNLEEGGVQKNPGKPDNVNAETLNKLNILLTKNKDLKELKKKNYKEEQIKLNKLLEVNETAYVTIVDSINKESCNKMNFVHKILNEINNSSTNFINEFNESIKKVETFRQDLNVKRDERSFKIDYNFYINKDNTMVHKRFALEEFLDYDYVISDSENPPKNKDSSKNLNIGLNNNDSSDFEYYRAKSILTIGEKLFVDLNNLDEKEKEINTIISNLLNCENKIEDTEFLKIINYIENNPENSNTFMELLVTHFCQNEFVIIKSIDNFHNLINVLIIILNYSFDKKDIFDLCFLIMFIAEKGIYFSKDDKHITQPIFKIISRQSIFDSVNFWKDLIKARIEMVAKIDIRKEFEKRRKNLNNNSNTFLGKLFGGKKGENENIENEILKSQIYKEKSTEYFTTVFYYYIKHFLNFNLSKAEELLDCFKEKYNLDEKIYDYFKKVISSDNFFRKESEKLRSQKKGFFDYKPNKQFKTIDNTPIKCILFSLKYIDKEQYSSILCLNKKYHKQILKVIYKNILLYKKNNNISIKKHLDIWKILLDYKNIKKDYNYQKIKESNKNPDKNIPYSDIIDLDIMRTFFSKNKEEKMEKIKHILKAIASELPSLNYYQGMNQIAAFLLNICEDNEEEAFYIYMSFLKNSEYSNLYKNDLEKLNVLFYQFDRFINLFLPELYIYFKVSSVNSGYFISPWFITLFTNAFVDIDEKNNAKTIMMIWDLFIFSGWKALMKIGIILLKIKEGFIIGKLSDCLLPFLTGEILKIEIMDGEHCEQLRELCISQEFRISNKLFEDIQKEFEVKKNCPYFAKDTHVNTY